jgi:serine/threonine-protein kinase
MGRELRWTGARTDLAARAFAPGARRAHGAGRSLAGRPGRARRSRTAGELPRGASIGPFRIAGVIGRGGMAVVYDAFGEGQRVALKVARPDAPGEHQCRERLRHEAAILDSLRHPSIAGLVDAGLDDELVWIAIERVDGETLAQRIARRVVAIDELCAVVGGIATGLSVAHAAGVVPRDLKPENVIVTASGRPVCKLVDWGVSTSASVVDARITEPGVVSGTPAYMAPEQARGRAVGPPCDVYALGVIGFEMSCGSIPFDGESSFDILLQHVQALAPAPGSRRAGLPGWVDALVLAMLAKDPDDRPSLEAIRAALARRGADAQAGGCVAGPGTATLVAGGALAA